MASTYSSLKIELIGTGEQTGTWGATTNTNLGTALEEAIVGYANAQYTVDSDLTLTLNNTNASQIARNLVLNITSSVSLTATRNLIVPAIEKPYYVFNNTTGGQAINVKTALGTGIVVPSGSKAFVYVDGVNVVAATNTIPISASLTYKLPTTDGAAGTALETDGSGVLSWGTKVSSISFGTTGLTPSTSTTGAVTVAGVLNPANGGTGLTTPLTPGAVYANSTTTITSGTLPINAGGTGQTTAANAFNALSPIIAPGDLIVGSGLNTASRLPAGVSGYVLTVSGSNLVWAPQAAAGDIPGLLLQSTQNTTVFSDGSTAGLGII